MKASPTIIFYQNQILAALGCNNLQQLEKLFTDLKKHDIKIIDDDFGAKTISVINQSFYMNINKKYEAALILARNGLKISLDAIINQNDVRFRIDLASKNFILSFMKIPNPLINAELMKQIIKRALVDRDFNFAISLINFSETNNLDIFDPELVKSITDSNNHQIMLILARRNINLFLIEVLYNRQFYDDKDYKTLIEFLLENPNNPNKLEAESLTIILTKATEHGNFDFAERLFKEICAQNYRIDKGQLSNIILIAISNNSWQIYDLIAQKYSLDLIEIINKLYNLNKSIIEEILSRIDEASSFQAAKILLNKLISLTDDKNLDQKLEAVKYLLSKFPQLTINDIDENNINRSDPAIIKLLLENTNSDLIKPELAQRIFDQMAIFAKKEEFFEIHDIITKKTSLNYHYAINQLAHHTDDKLTFLLDKIPQEQITDDLKIGILLAAIEHSYTSRPLTILPIIDDFLQRNKISIITDELKQKIVEIINKITQKDQFIKVSNFLEKNGISVNYTQQLEHLPKQSISSDYSIYLLEKIDHISVQLAQDLLKKMHYQDPYGYDLEQVEMILAKTDIDQFDYAQLVCTGLAYKKDNLIWVLDRVIEIPNQNAIDLLCHYFLAKNDDMSILDKIIAKSPRLDLADLLKKIFDNHYSFEDKTIIQSLKILLEKIDDPITDAELSNKIFLDIIKLNDQELFKIAEEKFPNVDYNLILKDYTQNYPTQDQDNVILEMLLEKEEVVITGNLLKFLIVRNFNKALDLINKGAKLSLIDNFCYHQIVIRYFCQNSNYDYIKSYLSEIPQDNKKKTIDFIFSRAIELEDEKLLELIIGCGFDINTEIHSNHYPLNTAIDHEKLEIAKFLAKKHAVSTESVIVDVTLRKHHSLLEVLCEQGYNYKGPIKSQYGTQEKKYPIEIAIEKNNQEAAKIILRYLTKDDLREIENNLKTSLLLLAIDCKMEEVAILLLEKLDEDLEIKIYNQVRTIYDILYLACANNMLNLVKKLHETRNLDLSKKQIFFAIEIKSALISAIKSNAIEVIEYLLSQPEIADEDVLMAIADSEKISDELSIKIIRLVRNINHIDNITHQTILHRLVEKNKIGLIKKILDDGFDVNSLNILGETALHIAAKLGNKEIFELLLERGADPLIKDNSGNNSYHYALYHDNFDRLGISTENLFPFNQQNYNQIFEYLKKQPELAIADTNIIQLIENTTIRPMAAKFACLFDNESELQSYVEKHGSCKKAIDIMIGVLNSLNEKEDDLNFKAAIQAKICQAFEVENIDNLIAKLNELKEDAENIDPKIKEKIKKSGDIEIILISISGNLTKIQQGYFDPLSYYKRELSRFAADNPFHDLSIFILPEGSWDKKSWKKLAFEKGPKLTKYLFLAAKIEAKIGRAPVSFDEVIFQANTLTYNQASQHPQMAEIFSQNLVPEYIFERLLISYKEKTDDNIPDILINNDEKQDDNLLSRCYMKKLPKDDLRGFILGNQTNCCQYVGSQGHNCAIHGMTSPDGGFYVIFKKPAKGRCENLNSWIKNLDQSSSINQFISSFKEKSVKAKYGKIIEEIKQNFQSKYNRQASDDELKKIMKSNFKQELEGEIIAQSWAWISKEGNLVLDSWERLCAEYDDLFKPFMKKLATEILATNPNIKKILIGSGGCTPGNAGLTLLEHKQQEAPLDYIGYRDSLWGQYLIAQTIQTKSSPSPTIRLNCVIDITNQRITCLEKHFEYGSTNFKTLEKTQSNWKKHIQDTSCAR
jgi:ankyrin repeat protein